MCCWPGRSSVPPSGWKARAVPNHRFRLHARGARGHDRTSKRRRSSQTESLPGSEHRRFYITSVAGMPRSRASRWPRIPSSGPRVRIPPGTPIQLQNAQAYCRNLWCIRHASRPDRASITNQPGPPGDNPSAGWPGGVSYSKGNGVGSEAGVEAPAWPFRSTHSPETGGSCRCNMQVWLQPAAALPPASLSALFPTGPVLE